MRNFNSIKVQLKRARLGGWPRTLLFQFHKGTIKAANNDKPKEAHSYFNSIKVQLKQMETNIGKKVIIRFQFHKGTIKACARLRLGLGLGYFNSIKVQLKHHVAFSIGRRNFISIP